MKRLILLLLTAGCAVGLFADAGRKGPKVGEKAPEITLDSTLSGPEAKKIKWASLKGKVVVLDFWATWCPPCVASIPHMNELVEKFKGKPVQFISITDEKAKDVTEFLARKQIKSVVGLDTDGSMFKSYDVETIPHVVIVGADGRVARVASPAEISASDIEALVAKARSAN